MSELTKQATLAAVAGWTLGASRTGRTEYTRLTGYNPIPARMVPSHPLDSWTAWLKHLAENRPPELLARTAQDHLRLTAEESAYGFLNIRKGFTSPFSGTHANPRPNGSEAVLRAAFWGLAFHGDPDKAARYAYYDASLDHAQEGVWVPVAIAAAAASARPDISLSDLVDAFIDALPAESRLPKALAELNNSTRSPEGPREFRRKALTLLGTPDQDDAAVSGAFVLLGLLNSKSDPGTGMLVTAGCGAASTHTTAATALLLTLLKGEIAPEWTSPLGKDYIASFTLRQLDPPSTLQSLADQIAPLTPDPLPGGRGFTEPQAPTSNPTNVEGEAPAEPPSTENETLDSPRQNIPVTTERQSCDDSLTAQDDPSISKSEEGHSPDKSPPRLSPQTRTLLTQDPLVTHLDAHGLQVGLRYVDSPLALPDFASRLQINLTSTSEDSQNHTLALRTPEGWDVATRLADAHIPAGETVSFAAVAQPPKAETIQDPRLFLSVDGVETILPLVQPQPWMVAGPFTNADGQGYEHPYRPETDLDLKEVMSGRSNMGVYWERHWFPGHIFDLEPYFKSGPGVVYLYAALTFPKSGNYTLFASVGSGLKLWIDGRRTLAYHDYHTPVPKPEPRYTAAFAAHAEVKVLVKVLRANDPVAPLTLVFFDEDGTLVEPVRHST